MKFLAHNPDMLFLFLFCCLYLICSSTKKRWGNITRPHHKIVAKERKSPYWLVKYSNLARYKYLGVDSGGFLCLYPCKLELIQFDEHMLNQWVEATKWVGEILFHLVMIDGIQLWNPIDERLENPSPNSWKKHRTTPLPLRRIRHNPSGGRDAGSCAAGRLWSTRQG